MDNAAELNTQPAVNSSRPQYAASTRSETTAENPRHRLVRHGPQALATPELLARVVGFSAGDPLEAEIEAFMRRKGLDVAGLGRASVSELAKIRGMGPERAQRLAAALELGRRAARGVANGRPVVDSPEVAASILAPELEGAKKEIVKALLLDTKHRVLRIVTISVGSLDSSIVHPREVFQEAIVSSAAALVVAHNHPSGDPTPSEQDRAVTKRLDEAGKILGIELLDHIVVGDGRWVSLRQTGWS